MLPRSLFYLEKSIRYTKENTKKLMIKNEVFTYNFAKIIIFY